MVHQKRLCISPAREASFVLAILQQLYDIEDRGKTLSAEERLALRENEATSIWESLGTWQAIELPIF